MSLMFLFQIISFSCVRIGHCLDHLESSTFLLEDKRQMKRRKEMMSLAQKKTNSTHHGPFSNSSSNRNRNRNSIVRQSNSEIIAARDIVIGIPTLARANNPDYLLQTFESIQRHGIPPNQIYIHHGKEEDHVILRQLLNNFSSNSTNKNEHEPGLFHLIPRDTQPITIDYNVTRPNQTRVVDAFKDDRLRKEWRIQEAHDFMWTMQYLLDHTNASYLGFNQDDSIWLSHLDLPNLDRALSLHNKNQPIISLYSKDEVIRKFRTHCYVHMFCGMVSMIFRRDALETFLKWMEPLWKEGPIDWTLEDFSKATNTNVGIYQMVKHIGIQSSFKFNQVRLIMNLKERQQFYKHNKAKILPDVAESCTHNNWNSEHLVVIGISTFLRDGNPDYLKWTVESMRQNCIKLDQIHVMMMHHYAAGSSPSKDAPHFVLQDMKVEYDRISNGNSSLLHLVPPGVGSQNFTIDYHLTRPKNKRAKEAYRDPPGRRLYRIAEVHDFMRLAQHLLDTTNAPYIGVTQDTAIWNFPLPDLTEILKDDGITSLYSLKGFKGDCDKVYCGFVSMVFRRDTLQDFLKWMQPIWKEEPIGWLFEGYTESKRLNVQAQHLIVDNIAEREELEDSSVFDYFGPLGIMALFALFLICCFLRIRLLM
jgi:hypothetical protein